MSRPQSSGIRRRHPSTATATNLKSSSAPDTNAVTALEAHSPAAELWLESRLAPELPGGYRPPGEDRPFTIHNCRLATRLIQLVGYRFLALFIKGQEWRVVAFFAGMMSRGILPTAKIWASSRMLDMVQASSEAGGIDRMEVLKVAIMSMVFSLAEDGTRHLLRDNDAIVRAHVDTILERAYLSTQLSLSIPDLSSPYIAALMSEAGVLAGFESRSISGSDIRRFGGPFDALSSAFALITNLIGILSQLYLMYRALSGGAAATIGWSSVVLIGLSIAPSLLRTIGGFLRPRQAFYASNRYRNAEREIKEMARSGAMKQELILFGLKDWILARWDRVRHEMEISRRGEQQGYQTYDLGLGMMEEGVQTSFYVLLALRILPTNLSLGSIRLYQKTAESLLRSLRSLSTTANQVFNITFYIAAYVEAIELPSRPHLLRAAEYRDTKLLDFESYRIAGGMELVAKDLSFRYPGTTKDVLHGINLTIRPGTTLAIVGLNGGGKTTLVKALMGLYDHQGALTLNGQSMAAFDPASVHRRTSCLFQDFCKYSFTLRENVGIGHVERMMDDEAVGVAIERGGAGGVLDKVGMEGKLSRVGVPNTHGEGEVEWVSDDRRMGRRAVEAKKQADWVEWGKGVVLGGLGNLGALGSEKGALSLAPPSAIAPLPPAAAEKTSAIALSDAATTLSPKAEIEQSAKLSGGQWQRVAVSRVFMRSSEADLVIFDEPSASLDPKAESQLFERIHALSHQNGRRCTTIYISHRFSTVRKADQIAVVEDGTIVECGAHSDLMARQGRYAELYNLQKAGFEE